MTGYPEMGGTADLRQFLSDGGIGKGGWGGFRRGDASGIRDVYEGTLLLLSALGSPSASLLLQVSMPHHSIIAPEPTRGENCRLAAFFGVTDQA